MAIPDLNHPCWKRLADGAIARIKTQHLGTQLLCKRIERSGDPLGNKIADMHAFFTKWERILPNEVQQLTTV
ncbi:hypothetical protein [Rubrivivax gelatinosus]|jgi:hypothetical protein|uniref:Uncharacterized protein n=1 Tax=Rubrivivax gelatinosus TaxID=28068 RepID=A0A4R2M583_RUBGE|nr:hypothetical protein [Rubrivivax gelatinosus]MBK1689565.1 hypothetical protein [Rubrivivax gelatinosus]TCP01201.1 hypothetical protein EV684_110132 [Rubrivivax gelatinosus]